MLAALVAFLALVNTIACQLEDDDDDDDETLDEEAASSRDDFDVEIENLLSYRVQGGLEIDEVYRHQPSSRKTLMKTNVLEIYLPRLLLFAAAAPFIDRNISEKDIKNTNS